jgi:hypothetical protein
MIRIIDYETLSPVLRDFASYKSVIQGCSAKTVSEYLVDLRIFCRYRIARAAGIPLDGDEFDEIDVRDFGLEEFAKVTQDDVMEFLLYSDRL